MKRIINYNVFEGDPNEIKEGEILVTSNNSTGSILAIEKKVNGSLKDVFIHLPVPSYITELPDASTKTDLPATIKKEQIDEFCSYIPHHIINGPTIGYNMLEYNSHGSWSEDTSEILDAPSKTIETTVDIVYVSETIDISITVIYTNGVYTSGKYIKS